MTIDGGGTVREVCPLHGGNLQERHHPPSGGRQRLDRSVAEDKSERGNVLGYEVTYKIDRSPALGNEHIGEWLIPPAVTP